VTCAHVAAVLAGFAQMGRHVDSCGLNWVLKLRRSRGFVQVVGAQTKRALAAKLHGPQVSPIASRGNIKTGVRHLFAAAFKKHTETLVNSKAANSAEDKCG
jgi:hypothetical protein